MITLLIFKISLIIFILLTLLDIIAKYFKKLEKATIVSSPINRLIVFGIFVSALIFGHIIPYLQQESDYMLIDEYNANIVLYEQYSEDYAKSARQQIEQYQQMQSEMARTATVAQLQFWSEQQDSVGNQLTESIKNFQKLIMEQKLLINKIQSRVNRRPNNKWFFGFN